MGGLESRTAAVVPDKIAGEPQSPNSSRPPDITDRLWNEATLLASLPSTVLPGIKHSVEEAWQHKERAAFEIVSGVALGAVFSVLTKNPNPVVVAATTWLGRGFIGVAVYDLGSRIAQPMRDVWQHPDDLSDLAAARLQLGDNVGDAIFNYGLAVAGGIGGAKLGERYLAPTKFGTWLQGYKEVTVPASELKQLAETVGTGAAASEPHPLAGMARAFAAQAGLDGAPSSAGKLAEGLGSTVKMRLLPDGSQIGSTNDGSLLLLTKEGSSFWFENKRSLFGLRSKLQLTSVADANGHAVDLTSLTAPPGSSIPGSSIIGKDPSLYFDEPGADGGNVFKLRSGAKITTGDGGSLLQVEANGGARVYSDSKGGWKFSPADAQPSQLFGVNLGSASFNLQPMTDWLFAYKKGAEAGLAEMMLERTGDIGSGIIEHEILTHAPPEHMDHVSTGKKS